MKLNREAEINSIQRCLGGLFLLQNQVFVLVRPEEASFLFHALESLSRARSLHHCMSTPDAGCNFILLTLSLLVLFKLEIILLNTGSFNVISYLINDPLIFSFTTNV